MECNSYVCCICMHACVLCDVMHTRALKCTLCVRNLAILLCMALKSIVLKHKDFYWMRSKSNVPTRVFGNIKMKDFKLIEHSTGICCRLQYSLHNYTIRSRFLQIVSSSLCHLYDEVMTSYGCFVGILYDGGCSHANSWNSINQRLWDVTWNACKWNFNLTHGY